jgi:hypothetical protein
MNEIALRLNTVFGTDLKTGPFVRSLVHVRANDMTFTDTPNGAKQAVFDVLVVAFGDNGAAVDQISKTYTMTMDKDRYERMMKSGFVYDFTFPIKKPGGYQLRVALRDRASDRVGSANQFVDVPNLKKNRLTLSGIILENVSLEMINGGARPPAKPSVSDPLTDTSLRQFKSGTVLNYGFFIYNAKTDASRNPSLSTQIRLFRDGKLLFEGKPIPVALAALSDIKGVAASGSLVLGTKVVVPGDYVLEVAVVDNLAKAKRNTARQFVQFEVVD